MLKRRIKHFLFIVVILCLNITTTLGQDKTLAPKLLITYLHELELAYNIKFSYVDEDIKAIKLQASNSEELKDILTNIEAQTKLKIKKIDSRYYSLFKSTTLDVCGAILDNFKIPLSSASIEILDTKIATTTNINGEFYFKNIPRQAVIRIKHLGFKTKFITAEYLIKQDSCTSILLSPYYQQLEEIVVIQFLTTGLTKHKDASIQLNTNDFGILPGLIEPDVLQTVQALPGIKSIDETVSNINIRGGTNDQNLILWDGIKMYQSGHFFGLISAFNPYLTNKVTLIKNGTSAKYGDGVSGIVNMETNNEIKTNFFGGGGLNLIGGDVYGQLPISKKLAFQFSARRSITDFLDTPIYNRFSDRVFQDSDINKNNTSDFNVIQNETFYFYDFTGKLLYNINPNHKLKVSFINSNNNLDYTESVVENNRGSNSKLDQTNISVGASLESNWSSKLSTHINTYSTRYNLNSENITANTNQTLFQKNEVLETAIQLNTNYSVSNTLNWLNGYHFNEVGITNTTNVSLPPFKSNIKGVIRTHALYSEINYTSNNKKLNAKAGLRFNAIENINNTFNDQILEPRININYKLAKNLYAELLGEYKNQTTNQIIDLKQNFLGIEKRRWILSDGDSLPITKSKQFSLGFNYNKKDLFIGLEGFYKRVNGISTTTQGFQNQDHFNGEIGSYTAKGIEFLINKKTKTFSTWFSYTYNINNYTFKDITPNTFPNNLDNRHTASFASAYTYKNIKLSLGINYKSGSPYTQPLAENPINLNNFPNTINYKEPNSARLPHYFRADASAIYSFTINSKIKASAGASVLNLLSRKNILNTYYRLNTNNEIETIESVSLGITPNLNFRVRF